MNSDQQTTDEGSETADARHGTGGVRAESMRMTDVIEAARLSFEELTEDVWKRVERHPWRALGIALGVGYVVGGGLFSRLTGRLLFGTMRAGVRLAALPFVRDEVFAFIDALSNKRNDGERERRNP